MSSPDDDFESCVVVRNAKAMFEKTFFHIEIFVLSRTLTDRASCFWKWCILLFTSEWEILNREMDLANNKTLDNFLNNVDQISEWPT